MATAWEILTGNSTLPSGTAWEHLNNQQGGSGVGVVLLDGLEVEMEERHVDVEVDLSALDVEVETQELDVEIETNEYEVEIS